jgi:hypothetical protein
LPRAIFAASTDAGAAAGFGDVPDWAKSAATPSDIPTPSAPTPSMLARIPFVMNRSS